MSTVAKVLSPFFLLFLLFSMCHYAVNRCDKIRFFAFILAVLLFVSLLPILVTGQRQLVNSRIVRQPKLSYFHFYLRSRWYQIRGTILTFRVMQCHDLDLLGSWDVVGHVTIGSQVPVVISYRCSVLTVYVSPAVVEIIGPKYTGVMTLTFLSHVTS